VSGRSRRCEWEEFFKQVRVGGISGVSGRSHRYEWEVREGGVASVSVSGRSCRCTWEESQVVVGGVTVEKWFAGGLGELYDEQYFISTHLTYLHYTRSWNADSACLSTHLTYI
jgi:hypothetical protein